MKQSNKKEEKKELTPEVIERFMEARRIALYALNERLSKESKK